MPKGYKTCPDCGTSTGPRAYVCKNCNHIFSFKTSNKDKKSLKSIKDFHWTKLQSGDKIKVCGGPYYMYNGELIPMGYRGKFIVDKIDDQGIQAWGLGKNGGFVHIYMGKDYQNPETGVWKTKHKIVKFKKKSSEPSIREYF